MKKTLTILIAIILMSFAFCGCGAQKEILSHSERATTNENTFSTVAVETTADTTELEITEEESPKEESEDDKSIWPTTHWLADLIPHTDYITEVEVLVDKPSDFQANVTDLSTEDFGDYKYQLVVCGWETVLTSTDDMFIADHEDGIHRVVVHPNSLDKGVTYIHIWEVG